jgi:hypothetical protein
MSFLHSTFEFISLELLLIWSFPWEPLYFLLSAWCWRKKKTGRCVFHLVCFLVKKCINYHAQNIFWNTFCLPLTTLKETWFKYCRCKRYFISFHYEMIKHFIVCYFLDHYSNYFQVPIASRIFLKDTFFSDILSFHSCSSHV